MSPVSAQIYHMMRAMPIAPELGTAVLPMAESMAATSLALMFGKAMSNSIGPPGAETRFAYSYAQDSLFVFLFLAPEPQTSTARAFKSATRAGDNVTVTSPGFKPLPVAVAVDATAPTLVVMTDNVADRVALFKIGAISVARYSVLTPIHYHISVVAFYILRRTQTNFRSGLPMHHNNILILSVDADPVFEPIRGYYVEDKLRTHHLDGEPKSSRGSPVFTPGCPDTEESIARS